MTEITIKFDAGQSPLEIVRELNNLPLDTNFKIEAEINYDSKYLEISADDYTMQNQITAFENKIEELKQSIAQEIAQLKGLILDKGYSIA